MMTRVNMSVLVNVEPGFKSRVAHIITIWIIKQQENSRLLQRYFNLITLVHVYNLCVHVFFAFYVFFYMNIV